MHFNKMTHLGIFYALSSALLFGASIPAAKFLLTDLNPWLLAGLLYLSSGLGLMIVLGIRYFFIKNSSQEANLNRHDYGWLAITTILGGVLAPVLLMLGLTVTDAASASLLLNFESVFTALIAWIVFKEHTNQHLIFGMVLIFIGGGLLAWHGHLQFKHILGLLFILGACCLWSFDNNLTRKISAADPIKIVAIKSLIAGFTNCTLAYFFGATLLRSYHLLLAGAAIGILGYGVSLICFILGLRYIGTARTSAYFSIAPFVGVGIAILFLGESLSLHLVLATILMGWGVWLHLTEHHDHEHQHQAIGHEHKHVHDEHHQHVHEGLTVSEPHSHWHQHEPLLHAHPHYPDLHHRHEH